MNDPGSPNPRKHDIPTWCVVEPLEPTPAAWESVRSDVMVFQQAYFGLEEDDLSYAFNGGKAKVAILRDERSGSVIGFTYAEPAQQVYREAFHPERERPADTAYVQNTAIHPDYVGRGLVWPLQDELERQLAAAGFRFVERDAVVANGYAANLERRYRDRIVFAVPHVYRRGEQVYFRVRLPTDAHPPA